MIKNISSLSLSLFFVVSLFYSSLVLGEPDQLVSLYSTANQYEVQKKNDEANVLYRQILQQYPDTAIAAEARLHLFRFDIMTLLNAGSYADAQAQINTMTTSFAANPLMPIYLYHIANRYDELNKPDEAKALHQRIFQQYPGSTVAAEAHLHVLRSNTMSLLNAGNYAAAQAEINTMTTDFAANPVLPLFLYHIANRYDELNKPDEAKALHQRIFQQYPGSTVAAEAHLHVLRSNAMSLLNASNYVAAQTEINTMTTDFATNPVLPLFLSHIADRYDELKKSNEAQALFQLISQKYPDSSVAAAAFIKSARTHLVGLIADGNYRQADAELAELKSKFAQHPAFPDAIFLVAEAYYLKGMQVSQDDPNLEKVFLTKSLAVIENPNLEKTSAFIKASIYYVTGLSYGWLGEYANAAQAFANSYQADPKFQYADYCLFAQGWYYEKLWEQKLVLEPAAKAASMARYIQLLADFPKSDYAPYAKDWLKRNNLN